VLTPNRQLCIPIFVIVIVILILIPVLFFVPLVPVVQVRMTPERQASKVFLLDYSGTKKAVGIGPEESI